MFGLNTGINVGFNDCLSTQLVAPSFNGIYNPFRVAAIGDTQVAHNSLTFNSTTIDKIDLIGTTNYLKIKNV